MNTILVVKRPQQNKQTNWIGKWPRKLRKPFHRSVFIGTPAARGAGYEASRPQSPTRARLPPNPPLGRIRPASAAQAAPAEPPRERPLATRAARVPGGGRRERAGSDGERQGPASPLRTLGTRGRPPPWERGRRRARPGAGAAPPFRRPSSVPLTAPPPPRPATPASALRLHAAPRRRPVLPAVPFRSAAAAAAAGPVGAAAGAGVGAGAGGPSAVPGLRWPRRPGDARGDAARARWDAALVKQLYLLNIKR